MPNYQNGKIYKIVNDENDIAYIGSTTLKLKERFWNHCQKSTEKRRAKGLYSAMRFIGVKNFSIVLIKTVPCKSKCELETLEYAIINKYISSGVELYNLNSGRGSLSGTKSHMYGMKGAKCPAFKRGCLLKTVNASSPSWLFTWYTDHKKHTRSFSINKYGNTEAKRLAKQVRNEIYPLSDSE